MENKYNIILHTTTSCNYNCSYCNVVKDKKQLSEEKVDIFIDFIEINKNKINTVKFFGGEPLLAFKNIKYIIDNTHTTVGNIFELVTNTSLLHDEICEYIRDYFQIVFFSIDSENFFDYDTVLGLIDTYHLKDKVYFNLVITPGKEDIAYSQFETIYNRGYKNFNVLPVYFTKEWEKENLVCFSSVMKKIFEKSLVDTDINLFGFQNNSGYNASLTYDALFVDVDLGVYYSDFVSTYYGKKIKNDLFFGNLDGFTFPDEEYLNMKRNILEKYEVDIIKSVKGQQELHKIMDYFSRYLNIKKGIIKD